MSDHDYMGMAIETTKQGILAGQSPFGAVIVRGNTFIAATHNTVWRDLDPTAHAEVNAIRVAAKSLATFDLSGCTLYSTCEPCPMCLTAIHWARIDRVLYGADIADSKKAGFSELLISAFDMVRQGGSPLKVEKGIRRDECVALFSFFLKNKGEAY